MEWEFNIGNWANVEVNSSPQQWMLKRCKQMCLSSRTVSKGQLLQNQSPVHSQQSTRGRPRQPLQRCWQSKTQHCWGGTHLKTAKRHTDTHRRGHGCSRPGRRQYLTLGCRDQAQQDSKQPGPRGSQAGPRLRTQPTPGTASPAQKGAGLTVVQPVSPKTSQPPCHPTLTKKPGRRHHFIRFPDMFPSKTSQTVICLPQQKKS